MCKAIQCVALGANHISGIHGAQSRHSARRAVPHPVAGGRLIGKAKDAETLAYAGLPRQISGHRSYYEALSLAKRGPGASLTTERSDARWNINCPVHPHAKFG